MFFNQDASPVAAIIKSGNLKNLQLMIEHMPAGSDDINAYFIDIFRARDLALDTKLSMMETLLEKGADINQGVTCARMMLTPLQILCGWFDKFEHGEALLAWMLDHGAATECLDRSALCVALWFQRFDLVRLLADRGAELNYHGTDGSNILSWLFTMNPEGCVCDVETRIEALHCLKQIFDAHDQALPLAEAFNYNPDMPRDLNKRCTLPALVARYKAVGFMMQLRAMLDCGWDINAAGVDEDGFHGNIIAIWGQYASRGEDISPLLKKLDKTVDVSSPESGDPLRWLIGSNVSVETLKCLLPGATDLNHTFRENVGNEMIVALEYGYIYHILYTCRDHEADAEKYQYCAEVCRLLLEHGADANVVMKRELQEEYQDNGRGWGQFRTEETMLESAAQFDNFDVFCALLDHGADPHKPMCVTGEVFEIYVVSRFNDRTPERPLPYLKELDKRGLLDVNIRNSLNNSPLLAAAAQCYTPLLEYLLEKGADVNATGGFDNAPALQRAISQWNFIDKEERRKTVELLLKHGADPEALDPDGDTALMSAAAYGCLTATEALIAHGVDVNHANPEGFTALHLAAWRAYGYDNHVEMHRKENCIDQGLKKKIINLLLEQGADIDAATKKDGLTALMIAMYRGHDEIFIRLMKRGADLNKTDNGGRTPLMIAMEGAPEAFVNFLCNNAQVRENVEHLDDNGHNLMHSITLRADEQQASLYFKLFTTKLKLSFRANKDGVTPLHYAVFRGHAGLINDIAALGIDVNCADSKGNTPLHIAMFSDPERLDYDKMEVMVTNLLTAGANPRLENADGVTPLDVASERGFKSCVGQMSMVPVSGGTSLN